MIELENIVKIYPGSAQPAVNDLSFKVAEGETCVLIGPSGCGKTTTLKMINRLIEPTSGRIILQGKNVLDMDPVQLRRGIGYVIQQIGLFPHMTIAENINVVPRLLGWDKDKMRKRVGELIEMVGMDPADFRDRYPRQLSGGQRQRTITRDRLQNEFLRLQKRLKKTIAFVTHDIDEALTMGTMICILEVGGVLAQADRPAKILSEPASDFVAEFVGADRGLKRLNLVRVGDAMQEDVVLLAASEKAESALEILRSWGHDSAIVVDDEEKLVGYVSLESARRNPNKKVGDIAREIIASTEVEATMKDAFSVMLSFSLSYMPVLGEEDKVVGIITVEDAQRLIQSKV
ncbi:MAG: ATP-binding cassette domain-containing protein [Anaerolineales bacterium]